MTFSITTLIITMICHYAEWNYAECRIFFSFMMSVIVPSVVMLNAVMLGVVMQNVVMLSVVMLSVMAPILILVKRPQLTHGTWINPLIARNKHASLFAGNIRQFLYLSPPRLPGLNWKYYNGPRCCGSGLQVHNLGLMLDPRVTRMGKFGTRIVHFPE
jgi:hypothetical protein